MIRVAINGACGKVGLVLGKLILKEKDIKVVSAIEREKHKEIGRDYGEILGVGKLAITIRDTLIEKVDVVIDFSTPAGTIKRLGECSKMCTPIVIGTTGFTQEQRLIIEDAGKKIPCLLSPNMSVGANLLFKISTETAKMLGIGYDIEIVEAHHRFKKDAPSGTAKVLRDKIVKTTPRGDIPIHSLRGGDIIGEHNVIFIGEGEVLGIFHRAHSRDIYAKGAILAARFIVKAPIGLYSMEDVIGREAPVRSS
jgi:4-hydroxy-tetrahydrodipicolinate reductase